MVLNFSLQGNFILKLSIKKYPDMIYLKIPDIFYDLMLIFNTFIFHRLIKIIFNSWMQLII